MAFASRFSDSRHSVMVTFGTQVTKQFLTFPLTNVEVHIVKVMDSILEIFGAVFSAYKGFKVAESLLSNQAVECDAIADKAKVGLPDACSTGGCLLIHLWVLIGTIGGLVSVDLPFLLWLTAGLEVNAS